MSHHIYRGLCQSVDTVPVFFSNKFSIMYTIAIIGAGAAGCFAAAHLGKLLPEASIHIYESMQRPLAKVRVTGGGRCNLTNSWRGVRSLESVYPRGARLMRRLLHTFDHTSVMRWFESAGVPLVTQNDECVFPASQSSDDIIGALLRALQRGGVQLHTGHRVAAIRPFDDGRYGIAFTHCDSAVTADAVVVTTGGSPRPSGLAFLAPLGLETVDPVPALYGFTLRGNPLGEMAGHVTPDVSVRLTGTKFVTCGALLITHHGVSGPAILRLSSVAARHLHDCGYRATLAVNWWGDASEEDIHDELVTTARREARKHCGTTPPSHLSRRLWQYLLTNAGILPEKRWMDVTAKELRRLASRLSHHTLDIDGRTPHKEEFVTCGGVALSEVNPGTLESKRHPHLYFAGEVLDVDAVTGGFNLQAAWTMGYTVACAIGRDCMRG